MKTYIINSFKESFRFESISRQSSKVIASIGVVGGVHYLYTVVRDYRLQTAEEDRLQREVNDLLLSDEDKKLIFKLTKTSESVPLTEEAMRKIKYASITIKREDLIKQKTEQIDADIQKDFYPKFPLEE